MNKSSKLRLHQVIAKEKAVRAREKNDITSIYHIAQKQVLFAGLNRKYNKFNDDDAEQLPDESQNVQVNANDLLKQVKDFESSFVDIMAMRDIANCSAKADLTVDDTTILEGAPVTLLLDMEKWLTNLRTLVSKVPTLPLDDIWSKDEATGNYVTRPVKTMRTKKMQKPIVLFHATDKHPAQTQLVEETVTVGTWETTKISGALPPKRVEQILRRIDNLLTACKLAREQANNTEVDDVSIGSKIFDYLLS